MLSQRHYPHTLTPEELDQYLEQGWFRMAQTIFTTNFLNFQNHFYSAIWLRIVLQDYSADRTWPKLAKLNSRFRTEIRKASITNEKENLFAKYRRGISFNASSSLYELLYAGADYNVFNSQEVNIYDGDTLIASGYFDIGANSAAGITSFYDPEYKKHSLGKYLIYLKINYCKQIGLKYFYPGYFVPGYSFFNYKLEIGKQALEYLDFASQQWLAINNFSAEHTPLKIIQQKLEELQEVLLRLKIKSEILHYEFFEGNIFPGVPWNNLLDAPLILMWSNVSEDHTDPMIIYDVSDKRYHLINCISVWTPQTAEKVAGMYTHHLLKLDSDLFATETAEEMGAALSLAVKI
jgi:leucyl-tRNA---protein transferase